MEVQPLTVPPLRGPLLRVPYRPPVNRPEDGSTRMSHIPDPVRQAQARLGNATLAARKAAPGVDHDEALAEARRLLTEAMAERHILQALRSEPALTTEQLLYLANLLVVQADLGLDERNAAASMLATNGSLR